MTTETQHYLSMSNTLHGELAIPSDYRLPQRRGSEFTDDLLRRIYPMVSHDAAVVGVASYQLEPPVAMTAINLAIRAADYRLTPTLLIDANTRDPSLSRHFSVRKPGLAEYLTTGESLANCVQTTSVSDLSVLGIGSVPHARKVSFHPALLTEARNDYRFTVMALGPLVRPSQADAWLGSLDGIILVARYGDKRRQLSEFQEHVQRQGGKIIGLVMTGDESPTPYWIRQAF